MLAKEAARQQVDVAVQSVGLLRHGRRLVVMDVDSTLVQGEVIDMLAERAGVGDEVAAITERAMRGEIDFEESLRARVALLEGLPGRRARRGVRRAGARARARAPSSVRSSGSATGSRSSAVASRQLTDRLADDLGIDYARANELEVVDGRLTGPDRRRRRRPGRQGAGAARLRGRLEGHASTGPSRSETAPTTSTCSTAAGLGIAFNAKPVVQEAAHTSVNVPYLDAILYLLGISREDIEAADAAHGITTPSPTCRLTADD